MQFKGLNQTSGVITGDNRTIIQPIHFVLKLVSKDEDENII